MKRKIGEFIKEYSVRNTADEDIPVYSVTNENGFCTGYFSKDVSSKDRTTYKIVPRGCFAYNPSRINVGSIDWQNCDNRVIVSPLYVVFEVSDELNRQYLLHYLKSDVANAFIRANGAGSVRDNLRFKALSDIPIQMVSVEEQREIVKKIDNVSNLIRKGETIIEELDKLVKSRFVEMFGDPIHNTKGLKEATLPELGEFGRGVSKHRPRNAPELLGGEYPLIQTGEIAAADLYIKSYENTYSEIGFRQSKMWKKGTLCITIAANIAKTAILTFDACFPDSVVGFNANEKTDNVFIHYWFSFFQEILEEQAPESAQKNINLKILGDLKVIVPEKTEQDVFVAFVAQTDKSKHFDDLEVAA